MVCAWYMNYDTDVDQREPHQFDPPRPVTLKELENLGVLYYQIENTDSPDADKLLQKVRKDRGYTYEDCITCSREKLPNYDDKLKMFFTEHLHADEEIRLCTDGSGYFDVRDETDQWIRIELVKGDMIILPAGIYHRFTLDSKNYIEARRYFVGEPVWKAHNRPDDDHPARKEYLKSHGGQGSVQTRS